ncbi:hypothetical protein MTR_0317s0050 [Medicago truncatula]|uniref:Uncharacterized protein n=1 Tax=Medicago truncatula TaxID=3880 RepID=A0A072TRC2_MEDTR|nr:hypothetical protein MTR_0317s0050 [Medicago truncatula]
MPMPPSTPPLESIRLRCITTIILAAPTLANPQSVLISPHPVLIPTQHFLLAQIRTSTLLSHFCSSLNQNLCFSSSSLPPLRPL